MPCWDCFPQVIPHAVDYFTGKALEYDAEDYQDSDDDFEDEDDGFYDEDDDVSNILFRTF